MLRRVSDFRGLNEIREDMELIKEGKTFLLHEEETRRNYNWFIFCELRGFITHTGVAPFYFFS